MPPPTLQELPTIAAVASQVGRTPDILRQYINAKASLFEQKLVRKRGTRLRTRQVYRVHEDLKPVHRQIALWVYQSWEPPDCVHGFLRHRSIATHAAPHCGQSCVVTADVFDFFPSISRDAVRDALLFLDATLPVAELLADLCTLNGFLPPGTRCSPILANVAARHLDEDCAALGVPYTRYADDLAFSGPEEQVPTSAELQEALAANGFQLREGSYFCVQQPRAQYVTGLLVNDAAGPRIPSRVKRRLRQEVYYVGKHGLEGHCEKTGEPDALAYLKRVRGRLNQIASVEPSFALGLLADLPTVPELQGDLSHIDIEPPGE